MSSRYCQCGRKIVVFKCKGYKGVKAPKDNQHELCQKCYKSEQDRIKNKVELSEYPY